jgi:cytochrome c oxidase subunit 1
MNDHPEMHQPKPSFWPIVLAFGLTVIACGVIWGIYISVIGLIILLISIAGWTLENRGSGREEAHE